MSINEMDIKVNELRELRRMADEIAAEIDAIQDEIKNEMTTRDVSEIAGHNWKITWKTVVSNRLDGSKLKKELPEIAAQYTKAVEARRFIIA